MWIQSPKLSSHKIARGKVAAHAEDWEMPLEVNYSSVWDIGTGLVEREDEWVASSAM